MGGFYQYSTTLGFSWERVAQSVWDPHVKKDHIASDVISRKVRGNKLITKRLIRSVVEPPEWLAKLFGVRTSLYSIEESVIDRETKTLVLYARNITFTTPTQFVEKATYTVSPENRKWTTSTKQAWMEFSFYGLSSMLEKSTIDHYKNGAEQADLALLQVLASQGDTTHASYRM